MTCPTRHGRTVRLFDDVWKCSDCGALLRGNVEPTDDEDEDGRKGNRMTRNIGALIVMWGIVVWLLAEIAMRS